MCFRSRVSGSSACQSEIDRMRPKRLFQTLASHWGVGALCGPAMAMLGTLACHDLSGLAGSQELPAGTPNPAVYRSAAGAMALYQATLAAFRYSNGISTASIGGAKTDTTYGAFVDFVFNSGRLTDELQAGDLGCPDLGDCFLGFTADSEDARKLPEGSANQSDGLYTELQGIRNDAAAAIGYLRAYDDTAPPSLRGEMYTMAGYAELFLADLYCSGVPLSTLHVNDTTAYTYAPGASTEQIYLDALAKFDTALTLAGDSARVRNLARVGKGRALLALDSIPQAVQAVDSVPDSFTYQFLVDWTAGQSTDIGSLFRAVKEDATVADREGVNGLPYISSGDSRVGAVPELNSSGEQLTNAYGTPYYVPALAGGATPGIFPITVASGAEARLIQAEGALRANQVATWLTLLAQARADLPANLTTSMPPLQDPGTAAGRVTLLFTERAYDLFLSGHRQGDLRRLIRQYGQFGFTAATVYPIGPYNQFLGSYGNDVTAPIPSVESVNPLFHGCLSRGV